MHIPDGYLSPSTCAVLYAAALPFWTVALRRVRALLATRFVPLISLFAAFSFVVMMFNLPLPGGTTGHAVGIGMAAIVLGPWGATLAISVALAIQALLFGDGGVLALGANCFNMGVAGSWVAAAVYRLGTRGAALEARRRVVVAGLAGYCAINVAALLTAVELGVQPLLFHDATGAALYAPYPLGVALPAMMLGHLTFAGCAEALLTAGVVRYLQHSERSLLEFGGGGVGLVTAAARATRSLWAALGLLLVLTPLGLRTAGSAWAEWSPAELGDPAARAAIAAASGGAALPAAAPSGLVRLAAFWTAPLPGYAPAFLRSAAMGYLLSALFGLGILVLAVVALQLLVDRTRRGGPRAAHPLLMVRQRSDALAAISSPGFRLLGRSPVERTLAELLRVAERSLHAEETARRGGLLQALDARTKWIGLGGLVLAAGLARSFAVLGALFGLALLLALFSRLRLRELAARVFLPALLFTALVGGPALFLTAGPPLAGLPAAFGVSAPGARSVGFLLLRVETLASFSLLLVLTTPWARLLAALRSLRVPATVVVILGMTYRFLFLLLAGTHDLFLARRSRSVGRLAPHDARQLVTRTAGVLLSRTMQTSQQVYLAMVARGFTGEVRLLDPLAMRARDWGALAVSLGLAGTAIWAGR